MRSMCRPIEETHQGRQRMNLWEAQVIVSRQLLRNAIEDMLWEDTPDIGEGDWLAVIDNMKVIVPEPHRFDEAITVLEKRAKEWEAAND